MDYSNLDKNSSEQLYLQIRRMVLHSIREQELLPRQRVPSVNELSSTMGVSRMTVRQALQALIDEGYLYTVPGKGTFVAERPHVRQNLQQLKGWTEEILSQGLQPSTRLVSSEVIPSDRTTAQFLGVKAGTPVYQLVRVRLADDFPLSVEKTHLVRERFPDLGLLLHTQNSLYSILRHNYSVHLTRALQFLEAGEADRLAADLLDLQPGSPVLISERITYASGDDPIEYVYGMTRPGFVKYRTELSVEASNTQQTIVFVENPGKTR